MPRITGDQVRWRALAILQNRLADYLAAQLVVDNAYLPEAQQLAAPAAPNPWVRTWERLADYRALDEGQSPAIAVTTPGLATEPVRDEEGHYQATWVVLVYCVVREQSYERVAAKVGLYTGAISECLVVERLGEALPATVKWKGEGYNEIGQPEDGRTIGAGVVEFHVGISDVLLDVPLDGPEVDASMVTVHPPIEGL